MPHKAVFSAPYDTLLHRWLCGQIPFQFDFQVCWWHHRSGSDLKQWQDRVQEWDRESGELCDDNNLSLNVNKAKEITIDFRKRRREHAPVYINGDKVERVESFKFLGVQITNDLSWSLHAVADKKAHQRLYFLRRRSKFGMSATTLTNFHRCTIESILSGCITA